MARYIDAEKADVETIHTSYSGYSSKADIVEWLGSQPTADVEEVVRCKDCNHGHWNQETCHGKPVYYCDRTGLQVSKYSFCSYGERK
jgi:hypothetical protein